MGMAPPHPPGRTDGRRESHGNEPYTYQELLELYTQAVGTNNLLSEAAMDLASVLDEPPVHRSGGRTILDPFDCLRQAKKELAKRTQGENQGENLTHGWLANQNGSVCGPPGGVNHVALKLGDRAPPEVNCPSCLRVLRRHERPDETLQARINAALDPAYIPGCLEGLRKKCPAISLKYSRDATPPGYGEGEGRYRCSLCNKSHGNGGFDCDDPILRLDMEAAKGCVKCGNKAVVEDASIPELWAACGYCQDI